jgi:hypothetical protein
MLREEGWKVNHKRVERIWRRGGVEEEKQAWPAVAGRWYGVRLSLS